MIELEAFLLLVKNGIEGLSVIAFDFALKS